MGLKICLAKINSLLSQNYVAVIFCSVITGENSPITEKRIWAFLLNLDFLNFCGEFSFISFSTGSSVEMLLLPLSL